MINRQLNPAELEGDALRDWYLRPLDQIADERALRKEQVYHEFFFGDGRWEDARLRRPPAPPPSVAGPPRPEIRAAAPPMRGQPAEPNEPGGFFANYRPLPGGSYLPPEVPAPLNRVEPIGVGAEWYWLADGQVVNAAEVERIYAEQKRRARGEEESAREGWVRSEDRLKDGFIPRASQLSDGRREKDSTCHPNGGWELDPGFHSYPKRTQDYESQITHAPGLDYVVRNPDERPVKFDGCAVWDPRHQLLEAKGPGYDAVIDAGERYNFSDSVAKGPRSQGSRQVEAARGRPIDWHIAEKRALDFIRNVMPRPDRDRISFKHTPAK